MDISRCSGQDCPVKNSCKRFTNDKSDSIYQSWIEGEYKEGKCDLFFKK